MVLSSARMRTVRTIRMVFLVFFVSLSPAQSAFDATRDCYDRIAELGKDGAIRAWSGPAESGDARAQFCLGLAIQPSGVSIGTEPNLEEWGQDARIAINWIRRSAEQGFAPAQEQLALAYARGLVIDGVPQDFDKAVYWMRQAANQGRPFAHVFLGQWYRDGEQGLPIDKRRAYRHVRLSVELFRAQMKSSEFDSMMGYFGLQEEAKRLGRELTSEERAGADGWVESQLQEFAKNTTESRSTASAVEARLPTPEVYYEEAIGDWGIDVDFRNAKASYDQNDYKAAFLQFAKVAKQGNAAAQSYLSRMYYYGRGVSKDLKAARDWALRSARQGYAPGQFLAGGAYDMGFGGPKDHRAAANWYRASARQGFVPAQLNFGVLYTYGRGIPKDYVQAYKWLSLAAAQGHERAMKNLGVVERELTPEQIAEAKRLVREWKPRKE